MEAGPRYKLSTLYTAVTTYTASLAYSPTLFTLLSRFNTAYTESYMPTDIVPYLELSADLAIWLYGLLGQKWEWSGRVTGWIPLRLL